MKLANFNRENADVLAGGAAITANAAVSTHASGTASVHLASAVTIADSGGHFTSSTVEGALQELGAASSDMLIYDESSLAGTATSFDFQGAGVSAAVSGGTAVVTVTGGTASANIPIYDEGSLMGTATTGLNFTGSGVSGTVTSGTAVITVSAGGGLTQAYTGYNSVGTAWETMTSYRVYAKKVTLANDCLVTNIEAYLENDAAGADDQVESFQVAIYTDASGTPSKISAIGAMAPTSMLLDNTPGSGGDGVGRWVGVPIGKWLAAGDYWIALQTNDTTTILRIAYDSGGSDRYYSPGNAWFGDWGFYTPTTSSNAYSIRANTIR